MLFIAIPGTNVVWFGQPGGPSSDDQIFFYDASTALTTQVTNNGYTECRPDISATNIVWGPYYGIEGKIFMAVPTTYYYVNGTTGDDSWDGLAPEWDGEHGPKKTIQAVIDVAAAGAIVTVADGTYTGPGNKDLNFHGQSMTLRSANGADNCIIDCESDGEASVAANQRDARDGWKHRRWRSAASNREDRLLDVRARYSIQRPELGPHRDEQRLRFLPEGGERSTA